MSGGVIRSVLLFLRQEIIPDRDFTIRRRNNIQLIQLLSIIYELRGDIAWNGWGVGEEKKTHKINMSRSVSCWRILIAPENFTFFLFSGESDTQYGP